MGSHGAASEESPNLALRGAHTALGPQERRRADILIAGHRIHRIALSSIQDAPATSNIAEIDLRGFFVMPGFVNAHDHLQFALHPRFADRTYGNYIEWGEDIHARFSKLIARYKEIPKSVRLLWGGIRNLLCGVTTVCHHDRFWPELEREDFPVRVLRKYGWAHSVALGCDLVRLRAETPRESPFVLHACEGIDGAMHHELAAIDALGLLDDSTVLVHGLAMEAEDIARLRARGSSLILCPSSNGFLFGRTPCFDRFAAIEKLALGNDSPLTAEGDLLDEARYAMANLSIPATRAYEMVTSVPARIFHLNDGQGCVRVGGIADLVAVEDTGFSASEALERLSVHAIEMVMVNGVINLASQRILDRIPEPERQGLEPLEIEGSIRWVRAPVQSLLAAAEGVLGKDNVRIGHKSLRIPDCDEVRVE